MKKKIFLVSLIMLIITLSMIINTFALFESNVEVEKELAIGKWQILLNNEDLSLTNELTIDDFTLSASTHTEDNYFAPGRTATFDIVIDASHSDVSMEYELFFDDSAFAGHPNITLSVLNTATNQTITTNDYTGVIRLSDSSRVLTLRVILAWADNSTYDANDTELIGGNLDFVITANFQQYLGV